MKLGEILDGTFRGRKILLSPRVNLKENEYLVEKGLFLNGSPEFSKACLIHEVFIPDNGCEQCQQ